MGVVGPKQDFTGRTFGRLLVLSWELRPDGKRREWKCQCSCGSGLIVFANTNNLTTGNTGSCGCLRREVTGESNRDHGEGGTVKSKEYKAWKRMRSRCINKNNTKYHQKGIRVCKRWDSYQAFRDDMGACPADCNSVDRINAKRGYCKSNCRWANPLIQGGHTSRTIRIRFQGKTKTLRQWAFELGVKPSTFYARWQRGDRGKKLLRPVEKGASA